MGSTPLLYKLKEKRFIDRAVFNLLNHQGRLNVYKNVSKSINEDFTLGNFLIIILLKFFGKAPIEVFYVLGLLTLR